jgi:hypothetical protein
MLAAITRTYTTCVPEKLPEVTLKPFELNKTPFPQTVEEYIHHAKEWKRVGDCPSMVYEYHFWLHQYRDPGAMKFSRLLHDDVKGYYANGFDGLIQDGSQRSYFPNGLNFYVYAQTLFDTKADYEEIKKDYLSHAYGDLWEEVEAYLTAITEAFDPHYLMGRLDRNDFYSPENAEKLRTVRSITEKYAPIFDANRIRPHRAQTVAMRLLKRHIEFCNGFADVMILKAEGKDQEAKDAFVKFFASFGKYEYEIDTYFDQYMCFASLERVVNKPKTFYEV